MTEKFQRGYYQDQRNFIVAIMESSPAREFSSSSMERIVYAVVEPGEKVGTVPRMLSDLHKEGKIVRVRQGWYRAVKPEPEKDQVVLDFEAKEKLDNTIDDFYTEISNIGDEFLAKLSGIVEHAKLRLKKASPLDQNASPIAETKDLDISKNKPCHKIDYIRGKMTEIPPQL